MKDSPASDIAAIALGSNQGASESILQAAIADLKSVGDLVKVSSWYQTRPIGPAQPDYINGCLLLQTSKSSISLMQTLLEIEQRYGRTRMLRWGPRTLDLDLLFHGTEIISTTFLTLPHPRLHERGFVLAPLAEIYPNWIHPIYHKSAAQFLGQIDCSGVRSLPIFVEH